MLDFKRPPKFVGILAVFLLTLTAMGCQTTMDLRGTEAALPDQTPAFCALFDPIRWSEGDTDNTERQVKVHNAIWKANCEETSQ